MLGGDLRRDPRRWHWQAPPPPVPATSGAEEQLRCFLFLFREGVPGPEGDRRFSAGGLSSQDTGDPAFMRQRQLAWTAGKGAAAGPQDGVPGGSPAARAGRWSREVGELVLLLRVPQASPGLPVPGDGRVGVWQVEFREGHLRA